MANQEHVKRLKRNIQEWNKWRREHPHTPLNLRNADLSGSDLRNANPSGSDLDRANLSSANLSDVNGLSGADLRNANPDRADLSDIHLSGANLSGVRLNGVEFHRAKLNGANLSGAVCLWTDFKLADLSYADLGGACLDAANFSRAQFKSTNFRRARFNQTIFAWVDLSVVKELETATHTGPSCVDINSVILPHDEQTRLSFLRGVGFTETEIEYLPSLLTARPIEYQSLFISYAHQDEVIARRIYTDLRKEDVPCWFAPEDMKIGDKMRDTIYEAIQKQDKLLLILSEHAVKSDWVEREAELAFERERRLPETLILFPIRLMIP